MHWFLIALVAPFLWSLINHAEKYLISRYNRDTGIVGLTIFSSLFALLVLPIIYFFNPTVIAVGPQEILTLLCTGLLIAFAILLYLYALKSEDASHVIPFWFLIPIFGYIFGIFFLNEHLETGKIIGSLITLLGALILSLEFEEKIKIKKNVAVLMICSSILIALSDVIFKSSIIEYPYWSSIFWNQAGFALFGVICLFFAKRYRTEFLQFFTVRTKKLIAINIASETLTVISVMINYYSMLLAPVALILLISYTAQPLFVFIGGIVLTKFFPHINTEHLNPRHIIQKILTIIVMGIGAYFVLL